MTSKDICNRILFIDNRIFGLKILMNRYSLSNDEYLESYNSKVEFEEEIKKLEKNLKLNRIRKEKLKELNDIKRYLQ